MTSRRTQRAFYIAVCSGKGGVGKSTVATLLAARLAQTDIKTLLIDADFGIGDIATLTNVTPRHGFESLLSGNVTLGDAVVQIAPNLDVIATMPGSSAELAIATAALEQFGVIDDAYDCVVLDTAATLAESIIGLIANCDLVLTVTTSRIPAIADSFIQLKKIAQFGSKCSYACLINGAESEIEGEQAASKFADLVKRFQNLKSVSLGWLPADPLLAKAAENQSLVAFLLAPGTTVRRLDKAIKVIQETHLTRPLARRSPWGELAMRNTLKSVVGFDDTPVVVHT